MRVQLTIRVFQFHCRSKPFFAEQQREMTRIFRIVDNRLKPNAEFFNSSWLELVLYSVHVKCDVLN